MGFFRKPRRNDPLRSSSWVAPPLEDRAYAGPYGSERRRMIERHLWGRDVCDLRVLAAMARTPRQCFIAPDLSTQAYDDHPLEIGHGQTISQPYIVARMTELAELKPGDRVLEIGVGCGYQTAVLLELEVEVFGLEIVPKLAETANERLRGLGYERFHIRCADGYRGWPEEAPFQAIICAASPEIVPGALIEQVADRGRLVMPLGPPGQQSLVRLRRRGQEIDRETFFSVRFVPMIVPKGEAG